MLGLQVWATTPGHDLVFPQTPDPPLASSKFVKIISNMKCEVARMVSGLSGPCFSQPYCVTGTLSRIYHTQIYGYTTCVYQSHLILEAKQGQAWINFCWEILDSCDS